MRRTASCLVAFLALSGAATPAPVRAPSEIVAAAPSSAWQAIAPEDIVTMDRSIPQYNVGYGAVKALIAGIETRSPGLFFAGNYVNGISVSDCITGGSAAAVRVAAYQHAASRSEALHA